MHCFDFTLYLVVIDMASEAVALKCICTLVTFKNV